MVAGAIPQTALNDFVKLGFIITISFEKSSKTSMWTCIQSKLYELDDNVLYLKKL